MSDALVVVASGRRLELTCLEIRSDFDTRAIASSCNPVHENGREWCALLLHSAWSTFSRTLILASASREPEIAGVQIPRVRNLRTEQEAASWVVSALGLRYEPNWGTANDAIRAATALGIANLATVSGALGSVGSPANDLRILRNFIAHRNRDTAVQFRVVWNKYAPRGPMRPDNLLSLKVGAGGATLFANWIDQLLVIARACTT